MTKAKANIKIVEQSEPNHAFTVVAEPLLIDAKGASNLLSISPVYFRLLDRNGLVPSPIKFGRRLLWRLDELKAWCKKGCPDRKTWLVINDKNATTKR